MSRGKSEKTLAFAMSSVAATLLNFLWTCLYMSQNFDFIGLPAHLTTGSSIMPHKKNPDVFELMRKMQQNSSPALRNHFNYEHLSKFYHGIYNY
jgi:argininosuccinate lyase